MKKIINKEHIEGRIYEHDLTLKTVENTASKNYGKPFIRGSLSIATDEDGLNIVTVNYTYIAETTSTGKVDSRFTVLKNIIETGKTIVVDGFENATMVTCDTSLGVNDFYTNRDGEEKLVSAKINDGGFVHVVNKLGDPSNRNTFEVDMLINKTTLVEANPERNIDKDYLKVSGYVFGYQNALKPVDLVVKNPAGIAYFESLEVSNNNPTFTKVWGKIESQIVKTTKSEESAFGEAKITEYVNTIKEWVIIGVLPQPYALDDSATGTTADEVNELVAKREIYLAEVKKNQEEYQASRASGNAAAPAAKAVAPAAAGGFNF